MEMDRSYSSARYTICTRHLTQYHIGYLLIGKFELYGIRGLALKLITSFLSDRLQYVAFGSAVSSPIPCLTVFHRTQTSDHYYLYFLSMTFLSVSNLVIVLILYGDDTPLLISGALLRVGS